MKKLKRLVGMFFVVLRRDGITRALSRVGNTLFLSRNKPMRNVGLSNRELEEIIFTTPAKQVFSHALVDVIVCVHNAPEDVRRCLESVVRHTTDPFSIIIVDDGSQAETKEILESFTHEHAQRTRLIRNEEAQGYTLAANIGLRASTGSYAILLNSDTIVTPRWIDRLVVCAESDTKIGVVGPLSNTASWQSVPLIEKDGDWAENHLPIGITIDEWAEAIAERSARVYPRVGFLNGFCLMIKRELIEAIGIFDEVTFARGYGEENDYSLRTRAAGWQLAVCDDAYVYHAQSRSYSSERRKVLAAAASAALAKKYGQACIDEGVRISREDRCLEGMRARVADLPKYIETKRAMNRRFAGKRLLFVLPAGSLGGGANVVLSEATRLIECSVDVTIANFSQYRQAYAKCYPLWLDRTVFFSTSQELAEVATGYDAVIATANFSVEYLNDIQQMNGVPVLGYYIQDYEPLFYPEKSFEYKKAKASYELLPTMKLFTKTQWNAEVVEKYHHRLPAVIGASFEERVFAPRSRQSRMRAGSVRITAMIRPSSPRRGAAMTMTVLKKIKQRCGQRVDIVVFGTKKNDPAWRKLEHNFSFVNLGVLTSQEIARLFGESDIFIDLSTYQAMGLTAMEAMASGLAVVLPSHGGAPEFAHDGENALVVDSLNQQCAYEAIARLVEDKDFRYKISDQALRDMARYCPMYCVYDMLKIISLL